MLKVKLVKSTIGCKKDQIATVAALGLTKIRDEGKPLKLEVCGSISPQRLIHHESGHLQNFTRNPSIYRRW